MKDDIIIWTIGLIMLVALGLAAIGLYLYLDDVIKAYFLS